MHKLNNRQKINYSLVIVLIISIIVALFYGKEDEIFQNFIIVFSFNILIIVFYELWQLKSISLNNTEKGILSIITIFLKKEGFNNEQTFNFIKPYFFSYSHKQVRKIINKCNENNYKKHRLIIWAKEAIRFYSMFIIIDIIKENGLKRNIYEEEIANFSDFILGDKQAYHIIDYYVLSHQNDKSFPLFKIWQKYKMVGLLPMSNYFFLNKVISKVTNKTKKERLKSDVKDINKYQKTVNENFSKFEPLTINLIKIGIVGISLVSIFTSFYFLLLLLYVAFILLISQQTDSKYSDNKYRVPKYLEILKGELGVNFLFDRYEVTENKMVKYANYYTYSLFRFEILNIVRDKKPLDVIIDLIEKSGFEKIRFIKVLFEIAAADKVFSDKEDEYIYMVARKLNVPKENIDSIRDGYIKRGVTEKKIKQEQYKSTSSSSSSQGIYVFYSTKAYKILGVEKSASNDEIKKAYRKLVMLHHPDKFATQGKGAMEKAEEKFQMLTEAYELIKRLRKIK